MNQYADGNRRANFAETLQERLGRPTIPSLNGFRALAVLAVIAYHAETGFVGFRAGSGVMLFFVISGFLITWLLLKETDRYGDVSITNFYIRRALRIFPAFYCFLALLLILMWATSMPVAWSHALSAALYVSNYYHAVSSATVEHLEHTWSLGVEEQFYLLWPTIFAPLRHNLPRLTRVLLSCIALVWIHRASLAFAGVDDQYLYRAFDTRADQLFVGCLLAVALKQGWGMRFWERMCRPLAAVATIALLQLSLWLDYNDAPTAFLYRFVVGQAVEPFLLAIVLVQGIMLWDRFLEWRPLRYLGTISYGMYLYHALALALVRRLTTSEPGIPSTMLGIIATAALASVSFFLLERPVLKVKDRLQRPRSRVRSDAGIVPAATVVTSAPSAAYHRD